jgi:hypothetical protein
VEVSGPLILSLRLDTFRAFYQLSSDAQRFSGDVWTSLSLNFNKQVKLHYKGGFTSTSLSVGVILKVLKVLEKRERRSEKSKVIFINYFLRYILETQGITYLTVKHFSLKSLNLLKKVSLFNRLTISNFLLPVVNNYNYFKRVRRIKRRLKKRIFSLEGSK